MQMIDTEGVLRDFERDGVALLRGLLAPEEVVAIRAELYRYIREDLPDKPVDAKTLEADEETVRNLWRLEQHDPFFRSEHDREVASGISPRLSRHPHRDRSIAQDHLFRRRHGGTSRMRTPLLLLALLHAGDLAAARDLRVRIDPDVPTIAHAIKLAQPGDTIHLEPKVYRDYAGFYDKKGEPGKPITLCPRIILTLSPIQPRK